MQVLLINNLYDPHIWGGAERSVQILAESLAQEGHKAIVISANPKSYTRVNYINNVKVYYIYIRNIYSFFKKKSGFNPLLPLWHFVDTYNLWISKKIGKIIDFEKPDVIHTHNLAGFSVSVWSAVARRKLPLVHTLRDYYLLCPRSTMFQNGKNCATQCWYCWAYSLAKRWLSKHVDIVTGISNHILNQHLLKGYFKKTRSQEVIYNAYQKKDIVDSPHPGKRKKLRLGYLGNLKPAKGVDLLLKAFSNLPMMEYEILLGGKGPDKYVKYLKNSFNFQNIRFLGFVDPKTFFPNIDVLIVPSLWQEPLGRTVLEAYAYGIPVIASNRGGIPEIVDDEKTGFIFDPDYPESLVFLIKQLKEDTALRRRMGRQAKKKSIEFLPEVSLTQYMEAYRDAISSKKKEKPI